MRGYASWWLVPWEASNVAWLANISARPLFNGFTRSSASIRKTRAPAQEDFVAPAATQLHALDLCHLRGDDPDLSNDWPMVTTRLGQDRKLQ